MLVPAFREHHPAIEDERGDQQQGDDTACEQDEDLATLV